MSKKIFEALKEAFPKAEDNKLQDLANKISDIVNFKGEIIWDIEKPDGTPRKKLDTSFINKLGWKSKTNLDRGLEKTINSYKNEFNSSNQKIKEVL